jgi:hypothetical protein
MSVQRPSGSPEPQDQDAEPRGINHACSDPKALLDIISRLDGVIGELRNSGQAFSAQLVAMARMQLVMTVHQISEQEIGVLRSLFEEKEQHVLS